MSRKMLYLMRHGQTMFNEQHRIQGWCDSPLTELGLRQADAARVWFEENGVHFDAAYSSTSERCCDTLERITDIPYTRSKGLKEMNYGLLEAESERLAAHGPKEAETYYLRYGGSSSNDVRDRMVETLSSIMRKDGHNSVLAVSHGAASFNFLRGIGADLDMVRSKLTNCCIFVLAFEDDRFVLLDCIPNPVIQ